MYRDLQIVLLVLYTLKTNEFAFLAQLAEHKICNFGVISSILIEGSIKKNISLRSVKDKTVML